LKFARFTEHDADVRLGVVDEDLVYHLTGDADMMGRLQAGPETLIEAGRAARAHDSAPSALDSLQLLAPIPTPPTMRDFYAFEEHVKAGRSWRGLEVEPAWYEAPVFYFSNPYAVGGPGDVPMAPGTTMFDFELEVAAVVGTGGSDLSPEEGERAVLGYCVMNDWSARDLQQQEMRLSLGPVKGKDTATSLGPYLVTKDELEDAREGTGYRLRMTCEVNGRKYADAVWSDVYWSFGEMAAYASRGTEVRPGDVIGSGTCDTGCIMQLSRSSGGDQFPWLEPGDVVTAGVERLGSLVNRVVEGQPLRPLRG
jgi:2-keto-4-pentenoate hydratase/2-oxohepta-3-ene-1,7-dioic acid hydratase in catechol pathway